MSTLASRRSCLRRMAMAGAVALVPMFAASCGDGGDDPASPGQGRLVIRLSSRRVAPAMRTSVLGRLRDLLLPRPLHARQAPAGSVTSLRMRFHAVHLGTAADCSDLREIRRFGAPADLDLVTEPTLFDGSPGAGTYQCVVLEVDDQLTIVPDAAAAAAFPGRCVAGTPARTDLYRGGEEAVYRDLAGAAIPARGSRASPVTDRLFIFFSTNPSAATARANGPTPIQTILLSGALVVPGSTTFFLDVSNGVLGGVDGGTPFCVIERGAFGFR